MKRETKKVAALLALAVVVSAGVGGVASYHLTMKNNRNYSEDARFDRLFNNENVYRTSYSVGQEPVDFTEAAEKSVHAVVHIKSVQNSRTKVVQELPDFFDYFSATSYLFNSDPSIYCISAYNENGQSKFVLDPSSLLSPPSLL